MVRKKIWGWMIWVGLAMVLGAISLSGFSDFRQILPESSLVEFFFKHQLFDARLVLHESEAIGLSPKQRKTIEKLLLTFEEESIKHNAEIKIKELRFVSYIGSDKVDRREIESTLRALGDSKTNLFIDYINHLFEVRAVISETQRTKLKEILHKNRQKWEKQRPTLPDKHHHPPEEE